MNVWVRIAVAACIFSPLSGAAWAQEKARDAAVEKCWMEAHKEYPKDTGNDVNTSAVAKAAFGHYAACMQKMGLNP